jgi:hypothetical protein
VVSFPLAFLPITYTRSSSPPFVMSSFTIYKMSHAVECREKVELFIGVTEHFKTQLVTTRYIYLSHIGSCFELRCLVLASNCRHSSISQVPFVQADVILTPISYSDYWLELLAREIY